MHPIFSWFMHRKAHELMNKTLLPEASALFKRLSGDEEGFFTALNGLITALYSGLGDKAQVVVGLIGAWKLETIREKFPRASIPVIAFLVAYFGALEKETRGKPQASMADIEAAAARVAEEAKRAGSKLNTFFARAKQARAQPESQPEIGAQSAPGVDMNLNKVLGDKVRGLFGNVFEFGDKLEDVVQTVASLATWASILGVLNLLIVVGAIAFGSPDAIAFIVAASSAAWIGGPFVGFFIARGAQRRAAAEAAAKSENPNEKAGNGFFEGSLLILTNGFVGGVSTLAIAALCAAGAYADPSRVWVYLWSAFLAMGIAYFTWSAGDSAFDAYRGGDKKGEDKPRKGAVMGAFALLGIIFVFVILGPLVQGLFPTAEYNPAVPLVAIAIAFGGGVIRTRAASARPSDSGPNLQPVQERNQVFDFITGRRLLIVGAIVVIAFPLFSSLSKKAFGEDCSAHVEQFVEQIQEGDCEVVLAEGTPGSDAVFLCREAQECGALATAATPSPGASRTASSLWSSWSWEKAGLAGIAILFIFFVVVGAMASADDKKKKDDKHGAHKAH